LQEGFHAQEFGAELRRCRIALGWTAKQLALLYSEAIGREENPVDVSFIFHLEAGKNMLVDKGRRALLARLVDMPLVIAGAGLLMSGSTNPFALVKVDTKEFTHALEVYCDTWQQGTTYKAVKDIRNRLRSLERATLYSFSPEKAQMTELLCGYQMLAADVAAEQMPGAANQILTHTVSLSQEVGLYNTYAHALRQRAGASIDTFEQTRNYDVLTGALTDFQAAEAIQSRVSPFYQGMVNIRRGLVYAYLAKDKGEFTRGLNIIDQASKQIGKQSDDKRVAARLDTERYKLNRASAYLYSTQGSPQQALKELNELVNEKPGTSPRRGVHRDLLFAETYMAMNNYPMAVASAEAAVEVTSSNGMDTLFNRLEVVYRSLRNSSYGKEPDVARLGVQILKARQPELFA
jgi:tetratricopeptide (TPR) repeat protein